MTKYKITIGIEIHIELLTKTKLFSSSRNSFGETPNTQIKRNRYGVSRSPSIIK